VEIIATILLIVVVFGFGLWVFSKIAGGWLRGSDERRKSMTAEQLYGRFDDSKRR
jgi:hypothetical protein